MFRFPWQPYPSVVLCSRFGSTSNWHQTPWSLEQSNGLTFFFLTLDLQEELSVSKPEKMTTATSSYTSQTECWSPCGVNEMGTTFREATLTSSMASHMAQFLFSIGENVSLATDEPDFCHTKMEVPGKTCLWPWDLVLKMSAASYRRCVTLLVGLLSFRKYSEWCEWIMDWAVGGQTRVLQLGPEHTLIAAALPKLGRYRIGDSTPSEPFFAGPSGRTATITCLELSDQKCREWLELAGTAWVYMLE